MSDTDTLSAADLAELRAAVCAKLVAAIPAAPAPIPLHENGAFDDLACRLNFIRLGVDALKGLGAMMQPPTLIGEYQMDSHINDAAAVFRFIGEALCDPVTGAYEDMEKIQRAAKSLVT